MLIIKLTLHCKICNGLLCPKCRFIQYKFILTTNIILRTRALAHFSDKSFMNICCSVSVSLIVHVSLMHMVLLLECSKSRFLIAEWLAWKSKIMFGCFLTCNCALNIVVQILLSIHVWDMLRKVILRPLFHKLTRLHISYVADDMLSGHLNLGFLYHGCRRWRHQTNILWIWLNLKR